MRALISLVLIFGCAFAVSADDDVGATRNAFVATQDPLGESVTKVVYLQQNWTPGESTRFYFMPQGSQIIPYNWFLALQQVDSTTPFLDNQNVLKYRYLPQNPGPLNPDGLPVGFVADPGVGRKWLGMTCAACHTTEIRFGTTAYRIDQLPVGLHLCLFPIWARSPFKALSSSGVSMEAVDVGQTEELVKGRAEREE